MSYQISLAILIHYLNTISNSNLNKEIKELDFCLFCVSEN
jgi:hypothetical protein